MRYYISYTNNNTNNSWFYFSEFASIEEALDKTKKQFLQHPERILNEIGHCVYDDRGVSHDIIDYALKFGYGTPDGEFIGWMTKKEGIDWLRDNQQEYICGISESCNKEDYIYKDEIKWLKKDI